MLEHRAPQPPLLQKHHHAPRYRCRGDPLQDPGGLLPATGKALVRLGLTYEILTMQSS